MRRGNRYNNAKKERIIMIASAVFVLAALTMTGVYVKYSSEEDKNDGYHIDFSTLEEQVELDGDNQNELAMLGDEGQNSLLSEDALDYFPPLAEADSGGVKIPGLTLFEEEDKLEDGILGEENDFLADEAAMAADAAKEQAEAAREQAEASSDAAAAEQTAEAGQDLTLQQEAAAANNPEISPTVTYSAQAGDGLIWPVNGSVLISYSMDSTVYFATLQQYKRNPGVVMKAQEGTAITANAAGIVTEVFTDEELGNGVKVDIGRGYTAVYGQLKDLQVQKDTVVSVGTVLGYVAAPTKYYSVEGTNAYFALEKDGQPVDPFGVLE